MGRTGRRNFLLALSAAVCLTSPASAAAQTGGSGGTVLATGDSMIQIVDSFLERRLERRPGVQVHRDARISTGLSKPFLLNWPRHARSQARRCDRA